MTVAASLKFAQGGPYIGGNGEALLGRDGTNGGVITCTNVDNTNVVVWEYKLIEVPPESALALGVFGVTASSTFTEDVVGSYTVMLTVTDAGGVQAADVRVYTAGDERGLAPPPFLANADQCNFGGQTRGWKYLEDAFARYVRAGTPYVAIRLDQVNPPGGSIHAALSGDLNVDPTGSDFTYVAGITAGEGTISWAVGLLPEDFDVQVIPNPTPLGPLAYIGAGQRIDATSCRVFVTTPAGVATDCDSVRVALLPRL